MRRAKGVRLRDDSGGFWTRILINKHDPELVIKQYIVPDEHLTLAIAQEMMSSIKGSLRHRFVIHRIGGILSFNRTINGTYQYGIMKEISPDGTQYEPLKESTKLIRQQKGHRGPTSEFIPSKDNFNKGVNVFLGQDFILRATSKHIMEGLHVISFTSAPNGGKSAVIGWTGENAVIASMQDGGFTTNNPCIELLGVVPKNGNDMVEVPARPFIGVQPELIETLNTIYSQL